MIKAIKVQRVYTFTLRFVSIILLLTASMTGVMWGAAAEEPVLVTFKNSSAHTVRVNIISANMTAGTHNLGPKQTLELKVEYGYTVQLEYNPCPKQTTLSPMGSLNELNRTVLLRDDGGNIFIREKFSGARKQTRKRGGKRSIPNSVISSPDMQCLDKAGDKADPNHRDRKGESGNMGLGQLKETRKEDPSKPAPKKEIKSAKKGKAKKGKVNKKEKEKEKEK